MRNSGRLLFPVLVVLSAACGGGGPTAQSNGTISIVAGDGGNATVGTAVAPSPEVLVTDISGQPVANVTVTFSVSSGAGLITGGSQQTDAQGHAAVPSWTLGTTAGSNTLTASATGYAGSPLTFTATGTPGPAANLAVTTQPSASANSGVPLGRQPVVRLEDQYGNAVSQNGVQVTAALVSGGPATLGGTTTVGTNASGVAAFTNLSITGQDGLYTIGFSANTLQSVASSFVALGTAQGMVPIMDLLAGLYLNQFAGGLYPNGSDIMPHVHDSVGKVRAKNIRPLDMAGTPAANGRIVLLSVGMSNNTQEWCSAAYMGPCNAWTFMGQAASDGAVNHTTLRIVNGAKGSQVANTWNTPNAFNWTRVKDSLLIPQGLSEAQVQVIWLKDANANPTVSLPSATADAYDFETELGEIVRAAKSHYPNLQIVFLGSRTYAGYANVTLSPEPYAYEGGFSVKWLIQAQIDQMANGGTIVDTKAGDLNYNTGAPWIAWGPYLWADGTNPRSDGLTWQPGDVEADGTHPSTSGETKVGTMLMTFFKSDPHASCWFLAGGSCP